MGIIIKSIIATILYIVMLELTAVWILIPEKLEIENYNEYYILIQGICQLIIVVIFILLINQKQSRDNWKRAKIKWYLIAAIIGSLFVVFQSPLKWVYNLIFGTEYFIEYDFDGLIELTDINILSTIFFIPIAEELFFRKYIQENLHRRLKSWIAIIVASVLFALIHAPYLSLIWSEYNHDWHLFYLTFFGGLISGTIYYKSKSIGPSIIFHVFWNLMVVII